MAGAMTLHYLKQTEAASTLERAVKKAVKEDLRSMDAGRMGLGTSEVGDLIAKYVEDV
jgi:3-isopropylmalate dehydrogenase